uniref:EXPERA domain-containing protein n=1 Tax=viral metagenome TaxID=1070528 RepID=A0A6C0KE26_9ZZZZ
MKIYGFVGAIMEVVLFMCCFTQLRHHFSTIGEMNKIVSYWLGFTVLTGFWELVYLSYRRIINSYANELVKHNQSVWTNKYSISMILPWNLSKLFYSEYGAWADREYKTSADNWSFTIEGTHCMICGLFSLIALYAKVMGDMEIFYLALGGGMVSQFMNSLLYMEEYFIQTHLPANVNYDTPNFPCGKYLFKRPFMYINLLWMIMPAYAMLVYMT